MVRVGRGVGIRVRTSISSLCTDSNFINTFGVRIRQTNGFILIRKLMAIAKTAVGPIHFHMNTRNRSVGHIQWDGARHALNAFGGAVLWLRQCFFECNAFECRCFHQIVEFIWVKWNGKIEFIDKLCTIFADIVSAVDLGAALYALLSVHGLAWR